MNLSDFIPTIHPMAIIPHIRDLTIAYLLALPIGWNREHHAHSAGMRTFPLVAIASCGFVQAMEEILSGHPDAASRVVAGVITGIGFIGGGAILKGGGEVHGTATAASLWATGAIGISVAVEQYDVAVVICLFTAATLFILGRFKQPGQEE
jgi:putative Mg2+ transporter-C (MgtC) family protein